MASIRRSINGAENAAKRRRKIFHFGRRRLFHTHAGNGDNDKKGEKKMARMLSATAAAVIVIAALFPAVYTFAAFA